MDTLPKAITPKLRCFCESISKQKPLFIRSKPSRNAVQSACFDNVRRKIERAGGAIRFGWAIWQFADIYFEAEHHGVWQNRSGKLFDVTPQLNNYSKILFLPDDHAIYDPKKFRQNIIEPQSDDPRKQQFCQIANERNAIYQRYRTDEYIAVQIERLDHLRITEIENEMKNIILSL